MYIIIPVVFNSTNTSSNSIAATPRSYNYNSGVSGGDSSSSRRRSSNNGDVSGNGGSQQSMMIDSLVMAFHTTQPLLITELRTLPTIVVRLASFFYSTLSQ
jgi:hypothetical protein